MGRLKEQQQHQLKQQRRKEKKIFANIPHGRKSEKHLYDNETTETDVKKKTKNKIQTLVKSSFMFLFLTVPVFSNFHQKKKTNKQYNKNKKKKKKENNKKSKSVDCRKLFFFCFSPFFFLLNNLIRLMKRGLRTSFLSKMKINARRR